MFRYKVRTPKIEIFIATASGVSRHENPLWYERRTQQVDVRRRATNIENAQRKGAVRGRHLE